MHTCLQYMFLQYCTGRLCAYTGAAATGISGTSSVKSSVSKNHLHQPAGLQVYQLALPSSFLRGVFRRYAQKLSKAPTVAPSNDGAAAGFQDSHCRL